MKVIRIVPNLSSDAFVASRDFYVAMFDRRDPQRGLWPASFPRGRSQRARVERHEQHLTIRNRDHGGASGKR